mgnify:CR=1 FL=1
MRVACGTLALSAPASTHAQKLPTAFVTTHSIEGAQDALVMRLILRIALDTPLRRLFDYLAPADVAGADLIPGQAHSRSIRPQALTGMLMEVAERSTVAPHKLKPALEILDTEPLLDSNLLRIPGVGGGVLPPSDRRGHCGGTALVAALGPAG